MIHGRLAADRRIDLGEQSRRRLHEIDAALIGGRGESGHVADDASAERDDAAVAAETRLDQPIDDRRESPDRLVLLAVGQHADVDLATGQAGLETLEIERADDAVRYDEHLMGRDRGFEQTSVRQQTRTDADRVTACAELYGDGNHGRKVLKRRSLLQRREPVLLDDRHERRGDGAHALSARIEADIGDLGVERRAHLR